MRYERPVLPVLLPHEAHAVAHHLKKPGQQAAFYIMLYTGVRFPEYQAIVRGDATVDFEQRMIWLPGEFTKMQKPRTLHLPTHASIWLRPFLSMADAPKRDVFTRYIKAAAARADVKALGLGVKIPRKTWESWLFRSRQEKGDLILAQMGHTKEISLTHYLSLPFGPKDLEAISRETVGWME